MSALNSHHARFSFHSDALDAEPLQVYHFVGKEELSQPFRFEIELVTRRADLDLQAPVGRSATLTMHGRLGGAGNLAYQRHVHGILDSFEYLRSTQHHSIYRATLVPTLYPLAYTLDSRIYQGQTSSDIVLAVLKDGGLASSRVSTMLHECYSPRDYCVQHQESDLSFFNRLLENDGIFYFFDHQEAGDVLVLGDGAHAFARLPHHAELQHSHVLHPAHEAISDLRGAFSIRPGKVTLRDFRFKQPGVDLEVSRQRQCFDNLEIYQATGRYVDPKLGDRLAQVRLEEKQCEAMRYTAHSNCVGLMPGYTFQCTNHPRLEFNNEEYLIVKLEHEGYQPQALQEEHSHHKAQPPFQTRLTCIPKSVPFRPKRLTQVPVVPGVQTARVVGPPGEEIHCDEFGRVKVQFHWDREGQRDDNSSCWIRVSQPWGGVGQGGMFIPRIGQEVVVQFLEGDPDRPLIIGRVYNGENPVPHGLPAGKNISTLRSCSTPGGGGFNELRFDDTAGSEQVFFHAQKDHVELILNDHICEIAGNESIHIAGNQDETIDGNQTLHVGGNRDVSVDGNESIKIKGNQDLDIDGKQSTRIGADQDIKIEANQNLTISANQDEKVLGSRTASVNGSETEVVLGAKQTTVNGSDTQTYNGGQTLTVTGGQTQTINGDYTHTINGTATQTINGPLSWTITGGATVTTPSWQVAAPDWFTTGGKTGSAYGFSLSLVGASVSATGASASATGVSVSVTGLSASMTGCSLDITLCKAANTACELKAVSSVLESLGIRLQLAALAIFT